MSDAIPIHEIEGDLELGRDVRIGGDGTVRGTLTVDHDVRINGWLRAKNIVWTDVRGRPIAEIVDRGQWKEGEEYYYEALNPETGSYETSDVWYNGCRWRCRKTGTKLAPGVNLTEWLMVEGDTNFYVQFNIPNGTGVRIGGFEIDIEAWVKYANTDMTEQVMALEGFELKWTRDTGLAEADNTWTPVYVGGKKNVIRVDRSDEHGTGVNFGYTYRTCSFTCRMYIPVEDVTEVAGSLTVNVG